MAFPGRPAMVPGIPLPPALGIAPYMPPMLPSVMTMQRMLPVRPFRPRASAHKMFSDPPRKGVAEPGPPITVFIGNIVEHAPDLMIRHILASCGQVLSWKRIQGFGFCEFGSPESALRAIRILHDMAIGTKKLVVKVDANTTVKLNEYKQAQRKKQGKSSVSSSELDLEDYVDDQTRHADRRTQNTIFQIIDEFQDEMESALLEKEEEEQFSKEIIQNLPDPNRAQKSQEILTKLSRETEKSNIPDDGEDGKRELITREIGKFREIMKKQEAEREEERLRREVEMGKRSQADKVDKGRSHSRSRSLSTVRSARSPRSPRSPSQSKASSPEPSRHRNNHRDRRDRRSHSRSRERARERDRDREREREQQKPRQSKRELDRAAARELEEEEEAKERKKIEKKTREKEVAYQERVRMWESRERRKRKEVEKEKDRKYMKEDDMAKEAKKLKEFLEDYDDERDDSKFYKGRELARRMADRDKERESDDKDRLREKEEIDELRNKVLESEHSDPTTVYEQLLQEHEEMYKPKILIDVNAEQMVRQREREREREEKEKLREEMRALEEEKRMKEAELLATGAGGRTSNNATPSDDDDDDDDDRGADFGPPSNHNSPSDQEDRHSSPAPVANKKKKLDLKDVFNADEDEDSVQGPKRRKLVPLDYEDKNAGKDKEKDKESKQKKDNKKEDKDKDKKGDVDGSKSTEEKRKHIKSLIDKIPTDKSALFDYTIDWTMVDNNLMEKRIRPWINKKIIEYIGEPEPTLVDFICSKVLAGSQPQGILDDVQMVLDEEAEVFVVKMWRLLIYEIEAKKMGFVK